MIESKFIQSFISWCNTCCANDICLWKNLLLCCFAHLFELNLLIQSELSSIIIFGKEIFKLCKLWIFNISNFIMKSQFFDIWAHTLTRFWTEPDNFYTCLADSLSKHINNNIWWCTNQNFLLCCSYQVINNTCACHSLSSPWWALD